MEFIRSEEFKGKVAVVTAGGGVLCSAFAKTLAKLGCRVAVLDLNEEAAKTVCAEINAEGGCAMAVGVNCLSKESLEEACARVEETFGVCDILINGAGGNNPRATTSDEYFDPAAIEDPDRVSFFDLKPEGISFVFDLNVTAAVLTTQVFAKGMALAGRGCVLNISSMNAYRPLTKIPAYSAAKAAVSNFTQWLAVHFAKTGIRVNAIAPGFFVTNQNRGVLFDADGNPTARTGTILGSTPQKRFGEVSDLLGTLLWLASDEASGFVTGVIVPVDGGFNAYSGV